MPRQTTIEEFDKLPEAGPFYYELHAGEVVQVSRPKQRHHRIQRQLRKLLEAAAGDAGIVSTAFACRALPEYEFRVADIAFVYLERWYQSDPEDNLRGAPDLGSWTWTCDRSKSPSQRKPSM